MVERQWKSTGHVARVDKPVRRIPDYDPRSGAHFWTVATVFRVDPARTEDPTHTPYLDTETLVYISPVVCFHCEQAYEPRLLHRRCPGDPPNGAKVGP